MARPADTARIDLAALDPDGTFPARLDGDRAALLEHAEGLWDLEAELLEMR